MRYSNTITQKQTAEKGNSFSGTNAQRKMEAVPVLQKTANEEKLQMKKDARNSSVPIQMLPENIEMSATKDELDESYKRKKVIDGVYNYVKANYLNHKFTNIDTSVKYLKDDYKGSGYKKIKAASDEECTAIAKEILARIFHDTTASKEITPKMRGYLGKGKALSEKDKDTDGPDIKASSIDTKGGQAIKSEFSVGKACVITALMFAENGGVLGAHSVEELHFILSTRFKSTWRHYSDDKVYTSLYTHIGYKSSVPQVVTNLGNISTTIGTKTSGMASIDGHMVGFKKEGDKIFIRDNDEGLKEVKDHTKKTSQILTVWLK